MFVFCDLPVRKIILERKAGINYKNIYFTYFHKKSKIIILQKIYGIRLFRLLFEYESFYYNLFFSTYDELFTKTNDFRFGRSREKERYIFPFNRIFIKIVINRLTDNWFKNVSTKSGHDGQGQE